MASGWILEKVRRKGVHALHFPFGRVACDGAWVEMGRRGGGAILKILISLRALIYRGDSEINVVEAKGCCN